MTTNRLIWADAAKGVAVVAVVFGHIVVKHLAAVEWSVDKDLADGLTVLTQLGAPIRMPVFFMISGYFGARAIGRDWRTLFSSKVLFFGYLYLLWLAIHTAIFQLTPSIVTAVAHTPAQLIVQATFAPTNLWYLYALALYFVTAKVGRHLPKVTLACAVLLAVAPHLPLVGGNFASVQDNLVWFLAGCYLPSLITRWSRSVTAARLGFATVALALALTAQHVTGRDDGVLDLIASAPGAVVGLGVVVLGVRVLPLLGAAVATHIGRNTLPIYVLHLPLVAVWHTVTRASDSRIGALVGASSAMTVLYPFILTVLITLVALAIHRVVEPFAAFLFEKPRWLAMRQRRDAADSGPLTRPLSSDHPKNSTGGPAE